MLLNPIFDPLVDEFEEAWRCSPRPCIEEYVQRVSAQRQVELLRELVDIDIEMRIRSGEKIETPRLMLSDYLVRFPPLDQEGAILDELLVAEFRSRQTFGDQPDAGLFVQFARKSPSRIKMSVAEVLNQLAPVTVSGWRSSVLLFSVPFDAILEIGRQRRKESTLYMRVKEADKHRLIIASDVDRSVSRQHVRIERINRRLAQIENTSSVASIRLNRYKLPPQSKPLLATLPLLLEVGTRLIEIHPADS